MDDETPKKPAWPRLRALPSPEATGRAGQHGKQAGTSLRGKELHSRLQARIDQLLDELEIHKRANAQLKGLLEGIVLANGDQTLSLAFLDENCDGSRLGIIPRTGFLTVTLKEPAEEPEPPLKQA